jgi:hypothetical protein
MSFRICANCVADKAVTHSDLCDACEAAFDDNAALNNMTRYELAAQMELNVLLPEDICHSCNYLQQIVTTHTDDGSGPYPLCKECATRIGAI